MQHLKNQGVPGFEDSAATIAFIRRIDLLVNALNSRTPMTAFKNDPEAEHYKVQLNFYLNAIQRLKI